MRAVQQSRWPGIVLFALACAGPGMAASPPERVHFQGVLRASAGAPVDGTPAMTFRFFDTDAGCPGGGTLLLTEDQAAVNVAGGLFNVALGSGTLTAGTVGTLADLFGDHGDVYLEVVVDPGGGSETLCPRIPLLSSGWALNASHLDGLDSGQFLRNDLPSGEQLVIDAGAFFGIDASGPAGGGYFRDSDGTSNARLGWGLRGIDGRGTEMGGYFQDLDGSQAYASVGHGGYGAKGYGGIAGGFFLDTDGSGISYVGYGHHGIQSFGDTMGGHFFDTTSSSFGDVGFSTYKITGSGAVSFVQNHPHDPERVIVYAAPEGDEVATYTRGTARLVDGEARIRLGDTFEWVTNPDIGLTAHLTPRAVAVPLALVSLTTREMVVRGPEGGPSDVVFDYLVYGLRIGFEEVSIVQEKTREAYIPSMTDHHLRYQQHSDLRRYNALERFRTMRDATGQTGPLDRTVSLALRDAIQEYDPAVHPVPEPDRSAIEGSADEDVALAFPVDGYPAEPDSIERESATSAEIAPVETVEAETTRPRGSESERVHPVSVGEPVEAGDVLVIGPGSSGLMSLSRTASSTGVFGIVAAPIERAEATEAVDHAGPAVWPASVALFGVTHCKVDSGYGPIRPGDLLTTSPTPGHAMRADTPLPGTILGKALESLEFGTGRVRVLVMLR